DPASGEITRLPQIPGARQVNPQWSSDGAAIYFLADARGTSNIYRLDLGNQGIYELSNVKTGVSGLTALSPALSVAGPRDTMALTLLDGGGFSLVLIDNGAAIEGTSVDQIAYPRELALLPPIERTGQMVTRFLGEPGALPPDPVVEVEDYAARIRPEFISQAMIGGGTGASGTFVAGGISMHWSDMLGHHNLLTQLQGQITDEEIVNNLAAVIAYQNRERRLNWGGSVSQIPFRSASFGQAMVDADGEPVLVQRAVRFWEINRTTSGRLAYPLSRASRVEFEGGFRHISYDAEEHVRAFSLQTGERLVNERDSISAPESLNLGTANAAFVHDTSLFGTTSPVLGQRSRLEVGGVTGDLTFFTPLVDYRAYWMPFERLPVTVAGRAMHFGRYGADAEDPRLRPLYLGSPTLVRGYETGFRVFADPVFDRLQGSRVAVANAEARAPLTGIRGFIGGPFVPPIDLALFYDAGVAWSSGERPEVIGGDRSGVTSYGASLRTNLGGIVLDFSYVNPRQRDDRGWHWQFTVTPGF
ncbi:MAG: BamA/TamA family outer membrane protein, partial [Pseudomonadales bacterium]